jgi:hypothetical protein
MMAKCCFQIWERIEVGENGTTTVREKVNLPTTHPDWTFLSYGPLDDRGQPTPPNGADFAIRAYGGKCGHVCLDGLENLRPKSWHWVRSNGDAGELAERLGSLDYSFSENTARQNSIGRADLVALYSDAFDPK